jgi:transcriptional regulator of arginine metabolism
MTLRNMPESCPHARQAKHLNNHASGMQNDARPLGKSERQRLIASVITRKRVSTQFELLEALAAAGCIVTQATVSRDIHELGLEKVHDPVGRPRYALPLQRERRADPQEALHRILAEFGRRATAAQNIVVLQSELGSAPAIARALDRLDHKKVIGTLAGDDTCLVIAADAADAHSLAAELGEALA